MMQQSSLAYCAALAFRSSTSMLPRSSQATVTVRIPAIAAEAEETVAPGLSEEAIKHRRLEGNA